MTGYNIKGTIGFILIVVVLVATLFSGDFSGAGNIFLTLIAGMILYQVGRFIVRGVTGFDPHEGTTRSDRKYSREDEEMIKKSRRKHLKRLGRNDGTGRY